MRPEDIDKLFEERLGKLNPTPSADLWSRLQDRIEEDLPSKKEKKKPISMWARTFAVAAAITVMLSAGIVFYNVQQEAQIPSGNIAHVEQESLKEEAAKVALRDELVKREETVASVKESIATVTVQTGEVSKTSAVAMPVEKPRQKVQSQQIASVKKHVAKYTDASVEVKRVQPELQPQPARAEQPELQASFASAKTEMNTFPVEIIIKRTVAEPTVEEVSEFQQKRTLAKNIFKQVKNLSNGEQVNLSEIGLKADRIALETQIGKQKISKVFNL